MNKEKNIQNIVFKRFIIRETSTQDIFIIYLQFFF